AADTRTTTKRLMMSEVSVSSANPVPSSQEALQDALLRGRLGDPFAFLGPHAEGKHTVIRTFQSGAHAVHARCGSERIELAQHEHSGLFSGHLPAKQATKGYTLEIAWPGAEGNIVQETEDPYAFGLLLGELDLHLIAEGRHRELGRCLGAIPMTVDGIAGTRFAVWAPNA